MVLIRAYIFGIFLGFSLYGIWVQKGTILEFGGPGLNYLELGLEKGGFLP